MKIINVEWKEFNLDLEMVKAGIDALAPEKCHGLSSDRNLRIHMADDASDEQMEAIQEYMDGLTAESNEAVAYRSVDAIKAAKKAAKEAAVAKTWDQMSVIERKLMSNMEVTKAELIAAELL